MTQGTKEWADSNVNIAYGCEHNCVYCYAKGMAKRFRKDDYETWDQMRLKKEAIDKTYGKRKGRIMFPTSHDITSSIVSESIRVLRKMLKAGNEVLITTKPHLDVVIALCANLSAFKDKIQFRFTITSRDPSISKRYEPGAPLPEERYEALKYAFQKGFKTSVSVEPYLDQVGLVPLLVKWIQGYITESLWIGPMNRTFCPSEFWDKTKWHPTAMQLLSVLIKCDRGIDQSKIRYKDSFRAGLAKAILLKREEEEKEALKKDKLPNEELVIEFL